MTAFSLSSDPRPLLRGSVLDAVPEIVRAGLVGLAGGFAIYAIADLAFQLAVPFLAILAFALPVCITSGWLAFSFHRKAAWKVRRVWASLGMGIGMLMLLPAGYAGFELARLAIVALFGSPSD